MASAHIPVLLEEVVHNLIDVDDELLVDATIGGGGHGYYALEKYGGLRLVGIDADEEALALAGVRLSPFKERVLLRKGNFRDLGRILQEESIDEVDAVLFDLGISMYQMSGERGFSFADETSLDMRIDREEALTAREVVNRYGYRALTRIIREYGDEGDAERIARAIAEAKKRGPITNAKDLADIIAKAKRGRGRIHPATKTFQAIRIEVNRELANLEKGLRDATEVVKRSGRIGVITFHSIEDRMVKMFFKDNPLLAAITKKPIKPGREEIMTNRKARSAKLRIAEKL
ncbi:MAG: 16S rRNA (cytosine(1402)-N(4))-methyltransferase RsmH [Syntrophorhabdales bacterium]|jgi:16S rRNA (cytosine1402-N4)-methyltransferase